MTRPVVVAARRTPIGTAGHAYRDLDAHHLAAPVLRVLAEECAPYGLPVDDVILGNCMGPGGNLARVSALAAGLGEEVPGATVDRQCGSGLAAILQAGQAIRAGEAGLVLAGGVESASTAPARFRRGSDTPYPRAPFAPEGFPDPDMGPAAEALAQARGISRERQDDYARRSHERALATDFTAELVPLHPDPPGDGEPLLSRDQRPRVLRAASLARLPGAFVPGGTVTAGNSSPISDGAAAVAMVPETARAGRPGLALLAGAVVGCDPALPGWGPVPAVRRLLDRTGLGVADLAAVEIVEAFAAQVLAVTDALELDPGQVCTGGGALALGHPWGASGAVAVTRLFSRLVRSGAAPGTLGLATAAVGGGMGIAALFEVV
ncbi:thiolase family protein [Nonomuraea sp. NPDC050328]|uniref:thiolase family protein n=1 Tax=Nonomuraea sp. NPDC050328 TaxID=3364361 RepID=UPI00379E73AC